VSWSASDNWAARTPGHPEYGLTPGVETTTGPLGQGITNSVGMAIAERWLAEHFNHDGHEVINYRIYAMGGDGDMMEGICSEAASLAAHLGLHKLLWIYDNNKISIEGKTSPVIQRGRRGALQGLRLVRPARCRRQTI